MFGFSLKYYFVIRKQESLKTPTSAVNTKRKAEVALCSIFWKCVCLRD